MAGFDVDGARKAGYSDAEIVDHLATERKFDAAGARRSGYNDAELLTHLRAPLAPAAPATPERGIGETAARLAGNVGAGFNDRLADVLGAPFALANRGLRAVGVPIPEGSVSDSIRGGINAVVGQPPVPETTAEKFAHGAGGGVVDAATVLVPALGVSRAAQAGSLAQRVGTAAAASPGLQVASGVAGGAVGEATDSPLLGATAALGAPLGVAGAARAITPVQNALSPARAALVQAAQREGIPLSTGQVTGSRVLQNMEGAMAQLPGTAGAEARFAETQRQAFNRAVLSRAGENADSASPEVLNAARARIGGTIGEIANRNTLRVDDALEARLAEVEDSLRFLPAEAAAPVRARIEQLRGMVIDPPAQPTPTRPAPGTLIDPTTTTPIDPPAPGMRTIPGASYRMMDSQLGRSMRSTSNGDMRAALGDLRDTLRQAMDSSIGPDDAAAWQQARREYANLMVAAKAAGGAGAATAEGNISPLALRGALDQSTGGGYVWGRGDLNELARVGQGVLRAPPDSGTAGRSVMNALLTGAGPSTGAGVGAMIGGPVGAVVGAGAGLALPAAVRAAYVNPVMQAYLRNQAISPEAMQAIRGLRSNVLMQQDTRAVTD